MASQRSLYDVLNVAPDAEPVVIEAAYRALMKKYHPDQAAANEERGSAAEINRAFSVLRDPARRADYDHREWTRRQAVHLAELQKMAPPPRPRRAFGWSGWFVALLLAIVLFVLIEGRGGVSVPAVSNETMADAEPDHRSQPVAMEPAMVAAARGPNDVEREIMMRDAKAAEEGLRLREAEEARAEADEAADAVPEIPPPVVRERAVQPPQRAKNVRPGQKRPAESEEDFLQREGYIY